ncbi:Type III effector HopAG1 [Pseudomonas syringae pv. aceris]|nr:Type III effector HopAG1 [Pseudomonas syringae pv. aceris]
MEQFNTAEECRLAGRQDSVLDSIDGKEFMRLLQKYTASETTEEEFADLRASIPQSRNSPWSYSRPARG